ncbi:unnamed protein product [Phytophthora fragariaefolia]|uniref:Unnamed protein product n=1 Tax=Phytophthora fragariaefolia TaxID=1490495 RepID=A0A9W6XYG6_9STRA|nr:unnamed protein product [Phytophthora fragariaefolia]
MRLCGLHYHIEHIAGDANVWADIVPRWHVREAESLSVAAVRTRSLHVAPVTELSALRPMMDANFVFPTLGDIAEAQSTAGRERARLQVDLLEEDGVLVADGRPWVPTGAKDLLARISVVAHCGSQGHRDQEAMLFALKDRFFIVKLEDKIAQFIRQCLLCKHFKGPRLIPRPSLAGHSPVEVFTGLPASSALDVVVAPATEAVDERVIELGDMGGHLERLRTSLQEMHREYVDSKEKKRLLDMQAHKGTLVNFDVGDFVLWSRIDQ